MAFEVVATPFNPAGGDILNGAVGNTASTLISVPAGRTWVGTITISATAAGTAALTFTPNVVTPNTAGVFPQNSIVASCLVATAAVTGGSAAANSTITKVIVKNTTGSAINLTTALTGAGTTTQASFVANGVLLGGTNG